MTFRRAASDRRATAQARYYISRRIICGAWIALDSGTVPIRLVDRGDRRGRGARFSFPEGWGGQHLAEPAFQSGRSQPSYSSPDQGCWESSKKDKIVQAYRVIVQESTGSQGSGDRPQSVGTGKRAPAGSFGARAMAREELQASQIWGYCEERFSPICAGKE
jgi:hypothetical protein